MKTGVPEARGNEGLDRVHVGGAVALEQAPQRDGEIRSFVVAFVGARERRTPIRTVRRKQLARDRFHRNDGQPLAGLRSESMSIAARKACSASANSSAGTRWSAASARALSACSAAPVASATARAAAGLLVVIGFIDTARATL
jgi:hypothetical protein